jgi:hypothetical protein
MQVQLGMLGQELCYPLGLMRREVLGGVIRILRGLNTELLLCSKPTRY